MIPYLLIFFFTGAITYIITSDIYYMKGLKAGSNCPECAARRRVEKLRAKENFIISVVQQELSKGKQQNDNDTRGHKAKR
jgi:hypothetical protein